MDELKIPFAMAEIIFRKLRNELNDDEEMSLRNWLDEDPSNNRLYQKILDEKYIEEKFRQYEKYDKKAAWLKISKQISPVIRHPFAVRRLIPYAAAILILISVGGFLLFNHVRTSIRSQHVYTETIVPGTQKATLTLDGGKQITLNASDKATVISEQQVDIHNENSTLKYIRKEAILTNRVTSYNTLETPNGGEYHIVLSDGTMIWLNAASKIRYPVEFNSKYRSVEIEGEVYFDVAENPDKPFIVKTENVEIEVLGTSFNVMSYADEESIQTTLVKGKVRIRKVNKTEDLSAIEISPGEQAIFVKEENTLISKKVNTNIYTSWKDGKFIMDHESLESIMRRLGRWYNFETIYTDDSARDHHFSGTLKRYDDISGVLDMIAISSTLTFKIKEQTVTVSMKK